MEHLAPTFVIALLIGFMLYRKTKRTVGSQKLVRSRLMFRMILFGVVGCIFLYASVLHPLNFIADLAGLACGLLLAYYAVKHTEFEQRSDGLYYRTATWVNIAVLALLVGRIVYRMLTQGSIDGAAPPDPARMFASDPLTIGIFFVIITYYIRFFTFLLVKQKELS